MIWQSFSLVALLVAGAAAASDESGSGEWANGSSRCDKLKSQLNDNARIMGVPYSADRAAAESSFPYFESDLARLKAMECSPTGLQLAALLGEKMKKLKAEVLPGIHATHAFECENNPPTLEARMEKMALATRAIDEAESFFETYLGRLKNYDHKLQQEDGEDPTGITSAAGNKYKWATNTDGTEDVDKEPAGSSVIAAWKAADDMFDESFRKKKPEVCPGERLAIASVWETFELLSCDLHFSNNRMKQFSGPMSSGHMPQFRYCENEQKGGQPLDPKVLDGSGHIKGSDITGIGSH